MNQRKRRFYREFRNNEENRRFLFSLYGLILIPFYCMFQAVKESMGTECKCHGVSGSCTMKTCWTTLPPFRKVGDFVMKKYYRARYVSPMTGRRRPMFLTLRRSKRAHKKPRRSDLVFLQKSPNYCETDFSTGSPGTRGRK